MEAEAGGGGGWGSSSRLSQKSFASHFRFRWWARELALRAYGDRAFSICAPRLWKSILLDIRKSNSISAFKKQLKTYLFRKFISNGLIYY